MYYSENSWMYVVFFSLFYSPCKCQALLMRLHILLLLPQYVPSSEKERTWGFFFCSNVVWIMKRVTTKLGLPASWPNTKKALSWRVVSHLHSKWVMYVGTISSQIDQSAISWDLQGITNQISHKKWAFVNPRDVQWTTIHCNGLSRLRIKITDTV